MALTNKQVVVVFITGVTLMLAAFWAGLSITRQGSQAAATQAEARNSNSAAAHTEKPHEQPQPAETPQTHETPGSPVYIVRVASCGTIEQADQLTAELRRMYASAHTQRPSAGSDDTLYRVDIGPYDRRDAAEQVAGELAAVGRKGVTIITKTQY